MKATRQSLTILILSTIILFGIGNAITFILPASNPDIGALARSIAFAAALYGWGLVRLLSRKRFAVGFLSFIDVVYLMGFVSNLTVAVAKISGLSLLLVVVTSIIGISLSVVLFKVMKDYQATQVVAQ